MTGNAYKALGFLVWQGGKWYVRRHYGRYLPSARVAAGVAVVGALAVGTAVVLARREAN